MTEQGSERRRSGAGVGRGAGVAPRPTGAAAGGSVPGVGAAPAFGRV